MKIQLLPAALAGAALLGLTASLVHAQGNDLNLGPIQPANLRWGQRAQFTVLVSQGGKPAKSGVPVQFWFSGQNGIKTLPFTLRTNREGRISFTRSIPNWGVGWVDLNASCDQLGVLRLWKIKR